MAKVQKKIASFFTVKRKEEERQNVSNAPERDKSWGSLEDCSFSGCFWYRIGFVSMLQQKDCREGRR